jgi:hypothetical protein
MPNFKPKQLKKIKLNKKGTGTLDGKHKEFVNEFACDEIDKIPSLKCERSEIINRLHINSNLPLPDKRIGVEQVLDMQDRISEITKIIKNLKNKKKEYYLNNSKYIFDYFENKKNISDVQEVKEVNTKNKLLYSFFKIKSDDTSNENLYENKSENIIKKYLSNIDNTFIDVNSFVFQSDICKYCYKGEMVPLEDEGILICVSCSRHIPYLIENEKPSYKEPPKEVCFYAYKRINHFKEILAQFQGKETTQIPPEVIENIKQQIKKERIVLAQISNNKTKEILKKLGYNKYYEHIPFIKNKLGIKPPVMSQELEETLCNLFIDLQYPYSKYCPNYRVNFLNYYYTAYKLCELLGRTKYLPHFPMLKDVEKRVEQDSIWKKICEELNWEFIPTL